MGIGDAKLDPFSVGEGIARNKATTGISTAIQVDFGAFFELGRQYPKLMQKNLPRALNRAGAAAKTAGSKALRRIYNIKAKRVNRAIDDIKARTNSFKFETRVRSRGVGLINFGARQTKKGVSYAILKGQRRVLPGTFIAPMLGKPQQDEGKQGVFIRRTAKKPPAKGRYKGRYVTRGENKGKLLERNVLQRFVGPGPARMWGMKAVQDAWAARATDVLPREFNRLMERDLNRMIEKAKARQKR